MKELVKVMEAAEKEKQRQIAEIKAGTKEQAHELEKMMQQMQQNQKEQLAQNDLSSKEQQEKAIDQMRSHLAEIQEKTDKAIQKSNQKAASSSDRIESDNREPLFSIRVVEKETHDKFKDQIPKLDMSQVTGHAPTPEPKKEIKTKGGSMNNTLLSQSAINQTTEEMKNKSLSLTLQEMMNQTKEYGTDQYDKTQSMHETQQIQVVNNNLFEPPETIS